MTQRIHRHLLRVAGRVAPRLRAALAQVGRVVPPPRGRRRLPHFLARAVAGQQLSTAAAREIWVRVEAAAQRRGDSIPAFFRARNARALRGCGLSGAKVRALIAIREAHEQGLLSVRRLRRLTHAERAAHLRQIRGIGQWTADMVSIFYFNDPDVWPEGDVGVLRGMEIALGKRSKRTVTRIAAAFAPYRSFLALSMWRLLDRTAPAGRKAASKRPV